LLQLQTVAAVSRFAYGLMMLLAVGLGLSFVIAVVGIELSRQPPIELVYPLKLVLRAIASFVAAGAFAMLFNSSPHTVLAVGLLALGANGLRLVLIDVGVMLAPADFCSSGHRVGGTDRGTAFQCAAHGDDRGAHRHPS
jgi:uncharacterized membrane protein YjjB (DUF3815 family)